jgi:hypothetical protein
MAIDTRTNTAEAEIGSSRSVGGPTDRILRFVDFARRKASQGDGLHPLVAASMALNEQSGAKRNGTSNLVSLLLAHAARSRRRAQQPVRIRMQVLGPSGTPAVRLRVR